MGSDCISSWSLLIFLLCPCYFMKRHWMPHHFLEYLFVFGFSFYFLYFPHYILWKYGNIFVKYYGKVTKKWLDQSGQTLNTYEILCLSWNLAILTKILSNMKEVIPEEQLCGRHYTTMTDTTIPYLMPLKLMIQGIKPTSTCMYRSKSEYLSIPEKYWRRGPT